MPAVFAQVLPFFLIVGLGYAVRRLKALDERAADGLAAYVFWIGFPALLIDALSKAPASSAALLHGVAAYGAAMVGALLATLLFGRMARWQERVGAGTAMAAGVGNTAFLGLPLAVAVFGEAARPAAAALVAVDFIVVLSIGVAVCARAGGKPLLKALAGVAFNPVVMGAVLGLVLAATHTAPPVWIAKPVAMLAATGSPVALIALGAMLAAPRAAGGAKSPFTPVLAASALKLFAAPALAYGLVGLVGAPPAFRAVAVLLAACPTAVNVFIQAKAYGAFPDGVARIVALTTAVSCVTLTLIASWLG